jgi:hypothetical protein
VIQPFQFYLAFDAILDSKCELLNFAKKNLFYGWVAELTDEIVHVYMLMHHVPFPPSLPIARQPLVGGPPHCWGFTITLKHITLLWNSDQPDTETYTWQHTTVTGDRHPRFGGFRTRYPSKRAAQTHALDRAATGIDLIMPYKTLMVEFYKHTQIQRIKCGDPHGWWDDNSSDGVPVRLLTKCGLGGMKAIIKHTRTL